VAKLLHYNLAVNKDTFIYDQQYTNLMHSNVQTAIDKSVKA